MDLSLHGLRYSGSASDDMNRFVLLLFVPYTLCGQEMLSISQSVAKALTSHPLLAGAEGRIQSAAGLRRQAGLWPNPRFVMQSENLRSYEQMRLWDAMDQFAYLQQTFETAGKRQRRVEIAASGERRAELERELLRRQIAARVRQSYWAAAGAQRLHELLLENEKTFGQIVEYHEARVKEGAMAEADLLRVQLEAERIVLAANGALLDARRARIQLFREMGQTQFPDVRVSDPIELQEDKPPLADADQAVTERAEVQLARQILEQTRRTLSLQHALAKPNVEALAGYKRTNGYDTVLGGLQFEIPFQNRNQGNIDSATAEIRVAESNVAATEALVRSEVEAAQADTSLRRRQVYEMVGRLREQAAETARIAQGAYRLGGADLLRLLDAERLRIETELLSIRAWTEYRQSLVALEAAMGVAP